MNVLDVIKEKRSLCNSDLMFKKNLINRLEHNTDSYIRVKDDIKKLQLSLIIYEDLINTIENLIYKGKIKK